MDTQDMKVQALQKALADDKDQCGKVEVVNFNGSWKMMCSCYKLTRFSFYMWMRRTDGDYHPHGDITESEAQMFLRGLGHLS